MKTESLRLWIIRESRCERDGGWKIKVRDTAAFVLGPGGGSADGDPGGARRSSQCGAKTYMYDSGRNISEEHQPPLPNSVLSEIHERMSANGVGC